MRPQVIEEMGAAMGDVYAAVVDQIIVNMARHFPFIQAGAAPEGAWQYQVTKLAEMGQVTQETQKIILDMLRNADEGLKVALETAILDGLKDAEPELREAARRGLLGTQGSVPELYPNQMQAFRAYYRQSADHLNLVNTAMLESTQQAYSATVADIASRIQRTQTILNTATGEVVSGVTALNSAVRSGVKDMVRNGLTGFIDHAGRRWSPEAYVTMDIRSTMGRTARAAVWERQEQYGSDLYQVSHHDGARPLCYPWQGKVISREDRVRDVEDVDGNVVHVYAQSETTYGEAAGLFGVNCGHYPIPFTPGMSRIRPPEQNAEENAREYELSQQQRALERKYRYEKRDLAVLKAQGAPEAEIAAQKERVRAANAKLDDFCDANGRARRRSREGTPIKATFPKKDTYQAMTFDTTERDKLREFFRSNGLLSGPSGGSTPAPAVNVAQQATTAAQKPFTMNYGEPFNGGTTSRTKKYFVDARQTLDNSPESTRRVWSKCADRMKQPQFDISDCAHYSPRTRDTHYKTYKMCFEESCYQRKNTVFYHEYGHNIDNLLGNDAGGKWLSVLYKDGALGKSIEKECEAAITQWYMHDVGAADVYEAVKLKYNQPGGMGFGSFVRQALRGAMPFDEYRAIRGSLLDAGDDDGVLRPYVDKWLSQLFDTELKTEVGKRDTGKRFVKWVKEHYDLYQRADISDMFERYMIQKYGIARPFDVGHGRAYHFDPQNTPIEAFAEMYSATVTGNDSLNVIKEFFPESYNIFMEMLEGAAND